MILKHVHVVLFDLDLRLRRKHHLRGNRDLRASCNAEGVLSQRDHLLTCLNTRARILVLQVVVAHTAAESTRFVSRWLVSSLKGSVTY